MASPAAPLTLSKVRRAHPIDRAALAVTERRAPRSRGQAEPSRGRECSALAHPLTIDPNQSGRVPASATGVL